MKLSRKKLIGFYAPVASVVGLSLLAGSVGFEFAETVDAKTTEAVEAQSHVDNVDAGIAAYLNEEKGFSTILELDVKQLVAAQTPNETQQAEKQPAEEQKTVETTQAAEEQKTVEATQAAEEQTAPDPWSSRVLPKVDEFLNIRSEANPESALLGKLPRGAMAEVLENAGEWTKISSGSVTGYVKTEYLAIGAEAKQLASETCPLMATIQANSLRVRKEASEDAGVLTLVGSGKSFQVLEQNADWVKIAYKEGKEGYVAASYVTVDLQIGKAISVEEEAEAARKAAEEKARAEAAEAEARAKSVPVETVQGEAMAATVDETTLLAAVVQMEAGGQGYEGMLAVASVVMNRVNSGRYPNTITEVIYQRGQFPGAHNGILDRILSKGPRQDCIQVAQDALNGKNNAAGYLGFCSTRSSTYKKYPTYTLIGAHYFY